MHDKYGIEQDRYCYTNSDVLRNKLNLIEYDSLQEAELALSATRYSEYCSNISSIKDFNLLHLQALHHQLFQDIYDWAGHLRKVDISKGSTRFCAFTRIQAESEKLFKKILSLEAYKQHETLIAEIADIYCELNVIHPFREGNGRAQRFFFEELLFYLGMNVVWPNISKEQWVTANIDGYNGDLSALIEILKGAISK
jgi:cell filamentation protein